jgi:hypothetical protein
MKSNGAKIRYLSKTAAQQKLCYIDALKIIKSENRKCHNEDSLFCFSVGLLIVMLLINVVLI